MTVTFCQQKDYAAFAVRPFVRKLLIVVFNIRAVNSKQEFYSHLAVQKSVRYIYGDIEMTRNWIGCLPCHPTVREICSRQKILSICCLPAQRLGFD